MGYGPVLGIFYPYGVSSAGSILMMDGQIGHLIAMIEFNLATTLGIYENGSTFVY